MSTTLVAPPRAQGLGSLALQLTRARFSSKEGESLLWVSAVGAYSIVTATALTVTAGTVMFWNRWKHPHGLIAEVLAADSTFDAVPMFYFILALIACALVVPSAISLASGAAVLGARGRERRLATLRLLGLSSSDVTNMTLVDTMIQASIGALIGAVIYWCTHGLWVNLEMLGMAITADEMTLSWWMALLVCVAVVLLGLFSSWRGLRQVRISPLGVARLSSRPAISWWRMVAFAAILVFGGIIWSSFDPKAGTGQLLITIAVLMVLVQSLNIVGPLILQQISKLFAALPTPTLIWAARRIETSPKATWQRVSGLSLLSLIGGFVAIMPIAIDSSSATGPAATLTEAARWDFSKGTVIVLAFGLLLTAVSVFVSQASGVLERAEQSRSMHKMGAPDGFSMKVMWVETLGPFALAIILGPLMGMGLAYPMYQFAASRGYAPEASTGVLIMAAVLVSGLVLTVAALAFCHPLHHRILTIQERVND